jgi:hypothetical protein
VFSLAVVVLEALSDQRVRKAEGMAACMLEACDPAKTISARDLGIVVPPRVEVALARAVAMDVETRHKSAGELWTELTRAAREAIAAPPPPSSGDDWSRTMMDPPRSGPIPGAPLGLGGTVIMSHVPASQTPLAPGALARTAPLGQQVPRPSQPVPSQAPVSPQYAPHPAPPPRAAVVSAPAISSGRPVVPSSQPMAARVPPSGPSVPSLSSGIPSSSRARRSGVPVVVVIFILIAALAAGGVLGWRAWRAHRAMRAMVSPS